MYIYVHHLLCCNLWWGCFNGNCSQWRSLCRNENPGGQGQKANHCLRAPCNGVSLASLGESLPSLLTTGHEFTALVLPVASSKALAKEQGTSSGIGSRVRERRWFGWSCGKFDETSNYIVTIYYTCHMIAAPLTRWLGYGATPNRYHKKALNLPLPNNAKPIWINSLRWFPGSKPIDFLQHMANNGHIKKLLGGRQLFMVPALCLKNFGTMGAWDLDARIESGTGKKLLRTRRDTIFCQEITRKCASTAKKNNLLGHTDFGLTSYFMWGAAPLPRATWRKNDSHVQAVMTAFEGKFCKECLDTGVMRQGKKLRLVCIGWKPDLKLQAVLVVSHVGI